MVPKHAIPYVWLMIAFSYFVVFNLFDLSSTILALRLGLSEANQTLLLLSSRLGFGLVNVFLGVKIVFILGMGSMLFMGVRSRNAVTRKMIFLAILGFAIVFATVSVSNFLSIFSVISTQ